MDTANQRIKVLQHDLAKIEKRKTAAADGSDDDDDDDDLDDTEGLKVELIELQEQVAAYKAKLDEYEKNKKWNVDNMFQVKEERTIINPGAGKTNYTATGYAQPKDTIEPPVPSKSVQKKEPVKAPVAETQEESVGASKPAVAAVAPTVAKPTASKAVTTLGPAKEPVDVGAFETYPEFTEKYAETIEMFMHIPDFEGSKDYLLKYGDILLQENAANYLLLASLEDEMNGHREKMKRTARQSQFISSIAELAKTLNTHPGNCITPLFTRLEQREHLQEFLAGCKVFTDRIVERAVVKKAEIDAEREAADAKDLSEIPKEERLGPGGLDPLEVIETLPKEMVEAFESRDVDQLKQALSSLDPEDAEYHMKRCVDSGLWTANA